MSNRWLAIGLIGLGACTAAAALQAAPKGYEPALYAYVSADGTVLTKGGRVSKVKVEHPTTGTYCVVIPEDVGVPVEGGVVLASATTIERLVVVGSGSITGCQQFWTGNKMPIRIQSAFRATGAPADTNFTILVP